MSIDAFKQGHLELLVLLLLQGSDMHGYDIVTQIDKRSGGILFVREGSIYPLLYRLFDSGYISSYQVTVATKRGRERSRVMYHIENAGLERLKELRQEFDEAQRGLANILSYCEGSKDGE